MQKYPSLGLSSPKTSEMHTPTFEAGFWAGGLAATTSIHQTMEVFPGYT